MREWIVKLRKGYGKKLAALHAWNGWIVVLLAVTGLVLISGLLRGMLGEVRVWIKWLHIAVGVASLLPILYYLLLAGKHWKGLRGKPRQKANVYIVIGFLLGWFVSGVVLWQFRLTGPAASNAALVVHDLLTWIGLPYILYHSVTRMKWLKDPARRTVNAAKAQGSERAGIGKTAGESSAKPQPGQRAAPSVATESSDSSSDGLRDSERMKEKRRHKHVLHPAAPQPLYTRRGFIRGAIGVALIAAVGPSFFKWLGRSLGSGGSGAIIEELVEKDANALLPAPQPQPDSLPPIGGGAEGHFRVYSVTPIPAFDNGNWSFSIDGLVERPEKWDWEAFVKLKRSVQVSDFHCVTGWSVYNNTWEGIPLKELLERAGVKEGAKSAIFYSGDGVYTTGITLEQLASDDAMVAVMHDGKPIPSDLGGPVRLIMPKMYAYKSVKWLARIQLIEGEHIGYWEQRGYANNAWV
ncbi:molybdopterin-dependent oxidoreductase [Paenibacillus sp. J5C_2022]|uniref:molybdopterin-dependent oxidoreductase n=1 Tax=Paenibacillus sp. J5C2022 TaxID=2977129 RepID=UPI0021CEB0C0|nr:molybdopterin-dependent oxidoreductase [Paenibacillus sp. J5C2022]MCU6710210.1 molybdopterin-dependent oxidoreductase [Paenibacillus sp. J5C2022]